MEDTQLLLELLNSDFEFEAVAKLSKRGLFDEANAKRWVALGNMPNNQSVVHAQQSSAAAALVEKFTNGFNFRDKFRKLADIYSDCLTSGCERLH